MRPFSGSNISSPMWFWSFSSSSFTVFKTRLPDNGEHAAIISVDASMDINEPLILPPKVVTERDWRDSLNDLASARNGEFFMLSEW